MFELSATAREVPFSISHVRKYAHVQYILAECDGKRRARIDHSRLASTRAAVRVGVSARSIATARLCAHARAHAADRTHVCANADAAARLGARVLARAVGCICASANATDRIWACARARPLLACALLR